MLGTSIAYPISIKRNKTQDIIFNKFWKISKLSDISFSTQLMAHKNSNAHNFRLRLRLIEKKF